MTDRAYGVAAWDQSKAAALDMLRAARGPFVLWVVEDIDDVSVTAEGIYAVTPRVAEVALVDIADQLGAFIEDEGGADS